MATSKPSVPSGPINQHKRMAMGQPVDGKKLPQAPQRSKQPSK